MGFRRVFDLTGGRRRPGRIDLFRVFDLTLRRRHAGWTARLMSSRREDNPGILARFAKIARMLVISLAVQRCHIIAIARTKRPSISTPSAQNTGFSPRVAQRDAYPRPDLV